MLMVGTITQQTSDYGKVISQGPASGSFVSPCSPVNLVISSGQK
jgi:beta-lactam-binding protein with PASTA domain